MSSDAGASFSGVGPDADGRHYRALVEHLPLITYVDSSDDETLPSLYLSPQVEAVLGYTSDEWLGTPGLYVDSIHPDDRDRVVAERQRAYEAGEPRRSEYRIHAADGRIVWVLDASTMVDGAEGEPPVRLGYAIDITDRKLAEAAAGAAETRYRTLVEQLPLGVYVDALDEQSSNLYSSPQIETMLGDPTAEWLDDAGRFIRSLHPEDRDRVMAATERASVTGSFSVDYRLIARDGRVVWVHDEARVITGADGVTPVLQGYLLDITAAKAAEERLRHQAFHDSLTGLPNRTLFKERVEAALAAEQGRVAGMLIVDLDDFKAVNDRFGHPDGDDLLRSVGTRLREALPDAVLLARLGGDEFGVLIDSSDEPARWAAGAARIVTEALKAPFSVAGVEVFVTASVGLAVGDDVDELFRQADVAMYRAKSDGKAQHVLYEPEMNDVVIGRLALIGELRRARVEKDFVIHYQPVVELATGAVLGAEALLRWRHATRGIVPPLDFIPAAEESGLIVSIGRWVLEEACRQVACLWERMPGEAVPTISVNVSARQLLHPTFVDEVEQAITETAIDPASIALEITEGVVIDDPEAARTTLDVLRRLGVGLALDDFGTGYSSLSLLEMLPVDALKLHRSSVSRLGTSEPSTSLVRAIAWLGTALGLTIVAEGIETDRQVTELQELGVGRGQGYYFHRPAEVGVFEELVLRAPRRRPRAA